GARATGSRASRTPPPACRWSRRSSRASTWHDGLCADLTRGGGVDPRAVDELVDSDVLIDRVRLPRLAGADHGASLDVSAAPDGPKLTARVPAAEPDFASEHLAAGGLEGSDDRRVARELERGALFMH